MKTKLLLLLSFLLSFGVLAQTEEEKQQIISQYDLDKLRQLKIEIINKQTLNYQEALEKAEQFGWKKKIHYPNGRLAILVGIKENGKPKYIITTNREGAITTRTNKVHSGGDSGLDLNGEDMILGVWEVGDANLENLAIDIEDPSQ